MVDSSESLRVTTIQVSQSLRSYAVTVTDVIVVFYGAGEIKVSLPILSPRNVVLISAGPSLSVTASNATNISGSKTVSVSSNKSVSLFSDGKAWYAE